jgi:TetR/AcrR family transcriptional regulator, cholesterol catabolism regulator
MTALIFRAVAASRPTRSRPRAAPPSSPPVEGGLRAQHKHDKRERLRTAAWELFSEKGYDGTSTREIAERAGIATGTLFLYAKDKADLLFLVFEHRLAEAIEEGFRSLPASGLREQLLHLFRRCFRMYEKSPAISRVFVKELPGAEGPNADRVNAFTLVFLQRVGGLVEQAQECGEVRRDLIPVAVAQTVFGLYFMALLTWLSGFASLESAVDTTLAGSFDLLMDGLAARPEGRG